MARRSNSAELTRRTISVDLTERRRGELGLECATLTEDLRELLEERAAFVTPSREREKELRGELGAIARTIRLGREDVDFMLRPEPDFQAGRMLFFDPDTGEQLDSRPLLESERQATIPT